MFGRSIFIGIVCVIIIVTIAIALRTRAELSVVDDELASEIAKHDVIDSAQVFAIQMSGFSVGTVAVQSETTFLMTDVEVQNVADFSARKILEKYPQTKLIHFRMSGEREGLLHTIVFEGKGTGPLIRGEVICSDPLCNSEVFFNSQFTG